MPARSSTATIGALAQASCRRVGALLCKIVDIISALTPRIPTRLRRASDRIIRSSLEWLRVPPRPRGGGGGGGGGGAPICLLRRHGRIHATTGTCESLIRTCGQWARSASRARSATLLHRRGRISRTCCFGRRNSARDDLEFGKYGTSRLFGLRLRPLPLRQRTGDLA